MSYGPLPEDGELSEEEIKRGLRIRTLANEIPVLRIAFKNKGVQAVLDAVIDYLPSPTEVKPLRARWRMVRRLYSATLTMMSLSRRWPLRSPPTPLSVH